ncbi:MAG: hypothetical protein K9H25_23260 [Rhodospirillum sp.]|nr:hypothetical protein [Rhodospirillum sp.]MCF8501313.1 hypothetical protein [Rhodospirillum sp.]
MSRPNRATLTALSGGWSLLGLRLMVLAIAFQVLAPLGQAISLPLASGPRPLIICTGTGLGVLPSTDPSETSRPTAPWSCPVCSSVSLASAPLPPPGLGAPHPMGASQPMGWTIAFQPEDSRRHPAAWPRAPPLPLA